jgi:uncharacterized protein (TIGR02444 family)
VIDDRGNPFWDFSLSVYARPGVAAACLELQDRHDLDVNLLLYCLFAGSMGRRLTRPDVEEVDAAVRVWRDLVVRPLRRVRRHLKTEDTLPREPVTALRRAVQEQELSAERLQQDLLWARFPMPEGTADGPAAAAAMLRYLALKGIRPDDADLVRLGRLLAAAFSVPEDEAARWLAERD